MVRIFVASISTISMISTFIVCSIDMICALSGPSINMINTFVVPDSPGGSGTGSVDAADVRSVSEKDLRPLYPENSRIRREFNRMIHELDMNLTAEQVLKTPDILLPAACPDEPVLPPSQLLPVLFHSCISSFKMECRFWHQP